MCAISCALQTGGNIGEWGIGKVLMSMYEFLHKAPSRRPDYLELADTTLFPHRFSPTRRAEYDVAADRGIQIWNSIVRFIKFILQNPQSYRPKDKSHLIIVYHSIINH